MLCGPFVANKICMYVQRLSDAAIATCAKRFIVTSFSIQAIRTYDAAIIAISYVAAKSIV